MNIIAIQLKMLYFLAETYNCCQNTPCKIGITTRYMWGLIHRTPEQTLNLLNDLKSKNLVTILGKANGHFNWYLSDWAWRLLNTDERRSQAITIEGKPLSEWNDKQIRDACEVK